MGGDGGTISSNRTYLRGAGKACHTADAKRSNQSQLKEDAERARLVLSTCAVSGMVLDINPSKKNNGGGGTVSGADIVACPYGKLYKREKVLEALLERSQTGGGGDGGKNALGSHIRGMKDLHPVRFHVPTSSSLGGANGKNGASHQQHVVTCPITGSEIGSGNVPSFLIVRTKKSKDKKTADGDDEVARNPNVISEGAIKEMGVQELQTEYGPFEEKDVIRLAPPNTGGVFEEIQRRWEARMEEERIAKMKKKKDKKRKRGDTTEQKTSHTSPSAQPSDSRPSQSKHSSGRRDISMVKKSAVDEARSTVRSAVAQNPVLSNLFGTGKKRQQTEKEKSIHLFTRNC
ncbi:hypothetical protein ACHAXR_008445 [Thalassiosira sp. AJA248-18]